VHAIPASAAPASSLFVVMVFASLELSSKLLAKNTSIFDAFIDVLGSIAAHFLHKISKE
jgi:hypothetical protein